MGGKSRRIPRAEVTTYNSPKLTRRRAGGGNGFRHCGEDGKGGARGHAELEKRVREGAGQYEEPRVFFHFYVGFIVSLAALPRFAGAANV